MGKILNYYSPGIWRSIHIANNSLDLEEFYKVFSYFMKAIPCSLCRMHVAKYIQETYGSFKAILNLGEEEYRTFSWRFHNDVNLRLDKEEISFEEYQEIKAGDRIDYYGPGIWRSIHTWSYLITKENDLFVFRKFILALKDELLPDSQRVLKGFMKERDILNEDITTRLGLFYWSSTLHNRYNQILGKDYFNPDTAWAIYK